MTFIFCTKLCWLLVTSWIIANLVYYDVTRTGWSKLCHRRVGCHQHKQKPNKLKISCQRRNIKMQNFLPGLLLPSVLSIIFSISLSWTFSSFISGWLSIFSWFSVVRIGDIILYCIVVGTISYIIGVELFLYATIQLIAVCQFFLFKAFVVIIVVWKWPLAQWWWIVWINKLPSSNFFLWCVHMVCCH